MRSCAIKGYGAMNTHQIKLIQNGFAGVFSRKGELTERFYHHLFLTLPEVEELFHKDFAKQKEMFATMLASTVRGLVDGDSFQRFGESLALSHARFNLTSRQLDGAASSLMAALRDVMGAKLSPEEDDAWNEAITRLTGMMAPPEV
ncbi:globin domain protein [Phaeobacter gallaeciensis]|uniref:Globin domain protein n=2 Tax=Roseobacteraceae TaxID=2854170 RepID=A0A366WVQ6_9RHOB|nr:globin domain protein [Phaeobacter gallaeciensis]